ncbi:uncharacterized protein LOC142170617 [Nicotiana tabacum]|uniref:Uncharacterized protein LOC142170617 n=1 Tax=Nicotiana tabacum TaxID=4097 RepID=A0AC58SUH4_TOBAC
MTELVGSHVASNQKLEMQMRDLSREQNPKKKETLSSDTIANPKGSGSGPTSHIMVITTRSGKVLQGESEQMIEVEESEQEFEAQVEEQIIVDTKEVRQELKVQEVNREKVREKVKETPKTLLPIPRPPSPFPQRLARKVDDSNLEKFYDILKQLSVNIPFVEAFQDMPGFVKYLKDLITKKRTTKNEVQVGLGMSRPTSIRLQMADRSIKRPVGFVDDVLVKVGEFHLHADFVILDCVVDKEIPIILGKPFLAIGRALMDSERNEIKFRVNDEEVTFQASKGMKLSHEYEIISVIDVVDEVEDAFGMKMEEQCLDEALVTIFVNFDGEDMEGYMESVNALEGLGSYIYAMKKLSLDLENIATPPSKPSIIEPPQLEFKLLPPHLRYKFLGSNDTLPVIVSSLLNDVQVEKLLNVLKEHRQAIGWTIADIRRIPAGICKHKIQLENESKPSVEHQRRLNPSMQEVVKKEIIKWLDAEVVYPIVDSSWVSPVQCVPKKGGMTMIENDKNELIPTRTVTGWRVCMDYRKLNSAMYKDHFPIPFIDQMLDWLAPDAIWAMQYSGYFPKVYDVNILRYGGGFLIAIGEVLGQRHNKVLHPVYYAIKTLNGAQINYTVIDQELLAIIYAFEKFRAYLLGSKVIVYTDHAALCYLMEKNDAKPRLIRWVLLLQKFDFEIKDRKGTENQVADHLSRRKEVGRPKEDLEINDAFPDEHILALSNSFSPWYTVITNFLVSDLVPEGLEAYQKKTFLRECRHYYWEEPFLFCNCAENIIRRCVQKMR